MSTKSSPLHLYRPDDLTLPAAARNRPSTVRHRRGFTLVELVVTLAIIAIIATLGVPSFNATIKNNRLVAESNRLIAHIQLARSEAIKRNQVVSLCRSGNGSLCGNTDSRVYHQGWLVYADTDGRDDDYEVGEGDALVQIGEASPGGITIMSDTTGNRWLSFKSNGMLDENNRAARYILCADGVSTEAVPGRLVTITVSGQPRVSALAAGAGCTP